MGNSEGQVSSDVVSEEPKSDKDQHEVIMPFSSQAKKDKERGKTYVMESDVVITEMLNVPMPTSSLEANASAAVQPLDSQTNHLVSSSVSEVTDKLIVMTQAVQNTTQAMELIIEDEKPIYSAEEPVHVLKTKYEVPINHKCSKCNKVFSLRSTLRKHLQCHVNETNRTQLNKISSSPVKYSAHTKTLRTPSKKAKNILCPECGKGFHIHSKLKVHLCTHKGQYPFVCKTCGKGFKFSSNLKEHIYTHTKEKPYPCTICGMGFAQKVNMNRHISAIHDRKKGVKCLHCNRWLCRKDYLKLHIQRCHSHKCPTCMVHFEGEMVFEQHKTECTGSVILPKSVRKNPGETTSQSSASGCKGAPAKSPLFTPIRKKAHKSPSVVFNLSQRKRFYPARNDQLMSINKLFESDLQTDSDFQAEEQVEGEEEMRELLEEIGMELKEEGVAKDIVKEEDKGPEWEEWVVHEEQIPVSPVSLTSTYEMFDSDPTSDAYFLAEEQREETIKIVLEEELLELGEVGEGKRNVVEERVVMDPEENLVLEGQVLDKML